MKLAPGKVTALVGASGAGKSTIGALLMRFYDPTKGRILVDGVDLKEYDLESYHQQVLLSFTTFCGVQR